MTVSILIPFYNGLEFLPHTLQSVLKQTYTEYEVLIGVNGHEKDSDVWNRVVELASVDSRIRVLHYQIPPKTINKKSATLNQMVKDATYDTMCLLDADDLWLPTKLERQMELWTTKQYDVIGTAGEIFGLHTGPIEIPLGDISYHDPIRVNPIINSSSMFHRIDAYWSPDIFGVEDYDMWLRLYNMKKRFFNIEESLTLHRLHPTSSFNGKNNEAAHQIRQVWSKRHPVTIVTAYYPVPSKFSNVQYIDWIQNFLTKIPCHLIIYTDETTAAIFDKMRKDYLDRTKIFVKPFHQLNMTQLGHYWTEQKEMDHETYHTEYLYILWNEKTQFVHEAIQHNPFDSDYFFWCDIGAFRTPEHLPILINFPNPEKVYRLNQKQIHILQIEPFQSGDLVQGENGIPVHDFKQDSRVGGGIFGGHQDAWKEWREKYYDMMIRFAQEKRFTGKDQNIMASIYVMNPDFVHLVQHHPYFNGTGDKWFFMEYYLSTISDE
jgi:glycosyltransferase involved in cell wall biosynthesis